MLEQELESPYWRLDDARDTELGLWRLVRRLPGTVRPVLGIILAAAPGAALTVLLLQLASGVAAATGLLETGDTLQQLLSGGVLAAVGPVLLLASVYAVKGVLDTGVALAHARIGPAVHRVAEQRLLAAALDVELVAFDDDRFYDRMHRARDQGLDHLDRAGDNLVELVGAGVGVVAAAVSLAVMHPLLLPVLMLGLLPQAWAVLRSARLGYLGSARTVSLLRRLWMVSGLATERESAAELRACQAAPFVLGEYRTLAEAYRDQRTRVTVAQARVGAVGRALAAVGTAATYGALLLMLHAGWLPLAVAGAAVVAIRSATAALTRLVLAANLVFEQSLYIADYLAFVADADGRRRPAGELTAPAAPAAITLRGVGFAYPGGEPCLHGVDMVIRRGHTVALVGENESGKTTLAKLIAGLYRPATGSIDWDGADVAQFSPDSVMDRVAMVPQDAVRWPHTARANVRIGRHDRDDPGDRALGTAAAQARADEVVQELPQGWETVLSKHFRGGRELSGGQWQRLAVARGLFRDAPVLVCDEPTAPLDARAEFAVYESLRELAAGRTVVLITHRLASVRHADWIYVLHKGKVVEEGTHAVLVNAGGRYAELYALQARAYACDRPDSDIQMNNR
ncbi:ABC transporter ATP-binding protein [Kutzneria sp. CA-103260]|uniref:ABC transporter ATP-binding protein n=1 Tax=Kutzneria sp. CA-103260 TaxID=2802641 RepID=UPI001BA6606E|nr:ABC transporter ATP-binding protein [Kutzneria sp. CA-103260]QUQ65113.1 multidrug ABC transporter ATPase/permease [Kutzneria sp. CA-103260]